MQRQLLLLTLLLLQIAARGQTGYEYRYWFDHDDATLQTGHTATSSWTMSADVSGLSETLHAIHIQVTDADGVSSAPVSRYFVKTPYRSTAKGIYWYDTEKDKLRESSQMEGAFDIDVSDLPEGFHTLHYQVKGTDGSLSAIASKGFIKTPKVKGADYLNCLCMIDDQLYKQEQVSAQGDVINWDIDVSSLPYGVHRIFIQVVTPMGAASAAYQTFFMRATTTTELSQMKCYYAVDGDVFSSQTGHLSGDAFHFDLDVSSLTDGFHKLTCMLSNGTVTTEVQSQYFMKTPVGGDGIVKYEYWLNDADDQKKEVTLSQRTYPFSLITLLPVDRQPIRSQLFQFRVEQDKPVVYAKNDFHILFYDAAGRFTDVIKQYVDEQVRQEVTDVTPINNGDHKTVQTPGKDEIHWFKFYAEEGDTVTFRTDQAATLQVFSPEGKEIYSAQGSTSVIYGGCHTWSKGTYYVALHDVMGSRAKISLDYSHMDKYDVVRQDVNVVGNGGCSTIKIEGNGFRDLSHIVLYTAQGDSIHSVGIEQESDAQASITFDFSNATLGMYDAKFYFANEYKVCKNFITVEEARGIELTTTVTYPTPFLRGTSTTYTVKIENKGNMTAYNVPIYTYVSIPLESTISYMKLSGKGIKTLSEMELSSNDGVAIKNRLLIERDRTGFLAYLIAKKGYNQELNDSAIIGNGYFWIDISPNSTSTVLVEFIHPSGSVYSNYFTPQKWNPQTINRISKYKKLAETLPDCIEKTQYCYHNKSCEAIGGIASAGGTETLGSIAFTGETAGSIASGYGSEDTGSVAARAFEEPDEGCVWEYHIKPNCPPNPTGGGGTSKSVNSLDPNDIYGYTAESGSNAVKEGLTDVYYRIEFENDTAFATAAAHQIVITDTLDAKYFDLSSYQPTRVKIGEKTAELSGDKDFVTTVDMRPKINAIAQVTGKYDELKGIAQWRIESLDPMTMEPTDDPMEGVLPVNVNGSGIGEVSYNISLKSGLTHGNEVGNRASIVFDTNDPIMTPTWTNVIDRIAPESHIANVEQVTDTTAVVSIEATDELSGPWRYDVYVQYGAGSSWWKAAENIPADTTATVKIYEGIDHGFYVVATDSAGNVERKQSIRELTLNLSTTIRGDVNRDGQVGIADIVAVTGYMAGTNTNISLASADVNGDGQVGIADIVAITDIMAGTANMRSRQNIRYKTYFVKRKEYVQQ